MAYFLTTLLLASCTDTPQKSQEKVVFTSILPLKYFADKIVGDHYKVEVLVPPGTGPETYSPTPKQMKMLSKADAFYGIGYLPFETDILKKISSINPNLKVFLVSKDIDLIRDTEEAHTDHVHLQGIDPHIWSSPKEAKVISKNICDGMETVDPSDHDYYANNLKNLLKEIDRVDSTLTGILSGSSEKKFIIFHPALGYMARDYGLEQLSIEFEGKTPSPKHMQELIGKARAGNVKLVFIQKEFDKRNAEIVACEIGGKAVPIDPLDYNWPDQTISIAEKLAGNP